jgi:hypothetical protein
MPKITPIPAKLAVWIEARRRFKLSHCQIQMARELGMNPRKLRKLANHEQEPWKLPLGGFIEELYFKRFKRTAPEPALSIEELHKRKKERVRHQKQKQQTETRDTGDES